MRNLSFLQLVWAIVGYRQYDLSDDDKPAIPKLGKTLKVAADLKVGDLKGIRPRPGLPWPDEPLWVFISYSHKDERLRRELETHLKRLQWQGVISVWTDHMITAGEEWKGKIHDSLERADIILLLVSDGFVASDYCYDVEIRRALARHKAGAARLIPIILRAVDWQSAPFGKLQALPTYGKPVMLWTDRDSAWTDVAAGIRTVAGEIRFRRSRRSGGDQQQEARQEAAENGRTERRREQAAERSTPRPVEPLRVFISYSHKDKRLRLELETHLKLLQRQGVIAVWTDRMITAGDEWKGKIDDSLESVDIVLLLVSAEFLASDYCYDEEMTQALKLHEARQARVIPVILRRCDWHSAPFGKLQALPEEGKPVTLWTDRATAWTDVAAGIRKVAEQIHSHNSGRIAGL